MAAAWRSRPTRLSLQADGILNVLITQQGGPNSDFIFESSRFTASGTREITLSQVAYYSAHEGVKVCRRVIQYLPRLGPAALNPYTLHPIEIFARAYGFAG